MALKRTVIGSPHFLRTLRPLLGLPVSRIWLGYAQALFLELGRLHVEALPIIKLPSGRRANRKTTHGQATVMLDTDWSAQGPEGISLSRESPPSRIENRIAALRNRRVIGIDVRGSRSELILMLEGSIRLLARQRRGVGEWAIELNDPRLFPRAQRWVRLDHSLWLGVDERGRLVRDMCYGGPAS